MMALKKKKVVEALRKATGWTVAPAGCVRRLHESRGASRAAACPVGRHLQDTRASTLYEDVCAFISAQIARGMHANGAVGNFLSHCMHFTH